MLKLKEIRIKKGLIQQDIADILGVTRTAAARYELEQRMLNQDQIVKLCLALEVTPEELLGFKEAYDKYVKYLMDLKKDFMYKLLKLFKLQEITQTRRQAGGMPHRKPQCHQRTAPRRRRYCRRS